MIQSNIKLKGEPSAQALASGLATLGRYGDDYMVHAAEGETFVPKEILEANPALKDQLFNQMRSMGIKDPNRYVVGDALNSINPVTGQPEFWFKKIFKAIKKVFKKVLPIAAPIIGNIIAPGIGGLIASGLTAKLQGGSWGDALKAAGMAYAGGALTQGVMGGINAAPGGFGAGFTKGLTSGAMAPFQAAGNLFSTSGGTNPLSQGIFGGNYSAGKEGFMDYLVPSYNPAGTGTQTVQGGFTNQSGTDHAALGPKDPNVYMKDGKIQLGGKGYSMDSNVGIGSEGQIQLQGEPYKTAPGGINSTAVTEPDFFSLEGGKKFLQGKLGANLATAAIVGGIGYITAPDPASDEEVKAAMGQGSQELKAYDQYIAGRAADPGFGNTPEGQALLRRSGLTPTRNRQQMADITQTGMDATNRFFDKRYGGMLGPQMAAGGGEITGPGTGRSDSIPAMLSDGEFVMTAQAVKNAGNGNRDLGAARMYDMMNKFERAV